VFVSVNCTRSALVSNSRAVGGDPDKFVEGVASDVVGVYGRRYDTMNLMGRYAAMKQKWYAKGSWLWRTSLT
jgi:hypothetical protein